MTTKEAQGLSAADPRALMKQLSKLNTEYDDLMDELSEARGEVVEATAENLERLRRKRDRLSSTITNLITKPGRR